MTLNVERGNALHFIQSCKPQQNGFNVRFIRKYRHKVHAAYLFENLMEVRNITESWITIYSEEKPHRSPGRVATRNCQAKAETKL